MVAHQGLIRRKIVHPSTPPARTCHRAIIAEHFDKPTYLSLSLFLLPIIVSVACPTSPHPPLRLARRPNRGHIGGGGWAPPAVHACDVFIASGFSTTTLVDREVNAPRHYLLTKSGEIASNFSRNESEKKTHFAGTRTHDLKLRRLTSIPTRPPGRQSVYGWILSGSNPFSIS